MSMELLTAIAASIGALGSLVASVGVLVVNAKVDRFIGRVESLENAHNTHVNMPGLHGIR